MNAGAGGAVDQNAAAAMMNQFGMGYPPQMMQPGIANTQSYINIRSQPILRRSAPRIRNDASVNDGWWVPTTTTSPSEPIQQRRLLKAESSKVQDHHVQTLREQWIMLIK